jgi:hypothetical protein
MLNLQERTNNSVQLPAEIDKAFYLNTDGDLVTKDQNGNIQYVTLSETKPPKVYKALLSQSGTDAPTAIVLENTLGGEVVWSYDAIGMYSTEAFSSLPSPKDILHITIGNGYIDNSTVTSITSFYDTESGELVVYTYANGSLSDDVMSGYDGFYKVSILIEVYQ